MSADSGILDAPSEVPHDPSPALSVPTEAEGTRAETANGASIPDHGDTTPRNG